MFYVNTPIFSFTICTMFDSFPDFDQLRKVKLVFAVLVSGLERVQVIQTIEGVIWFDCYLILCDH